MYERLCVTGKMMSREANLVTCVAISHQLLRWLKRKFQFAGILSVHKDSSYKNLLTDKHHSALFSPQFIVERLWKCLMEPDSYLLKSWE